MDKVKIYEWLASQNYQTDYEQTQEYLMYFEIDMPKILEDYYKWRVLQETNTTAPKESENNFKNN